MVATKIKNNKTRKVTTGKKDIPAHKNPVATKPAAGKAPTRKPRSADIPSNASNDETAKATAGPEPVKVDRRRAERRQTQQPVAAERRKVSRRRQIDPTTCERDYTNDEIEFMQALDVYKRTSGRMFPTCSEILEVVRSLGYEKRLVAVPSPAAESFQDNPIEEPASAL